MRRSTHFEKVQRLNTAFHLLAKGYGLNEAVEGLVKQYRMSIRQAYRYLQQAQKMSSAVSVSEPNIAMTLKVPVSVASQLRAYAKAGGLTMGQALAHAVCTLPTRIGGRG